MTVAGPRLPLPNAGSVLPSITPGFPLALEIVRQRPGFEFHTFGPVQDARELDRIICRRGEPGRRTLRIGKVTAKEVFDPPRGSHPGVFIEKSPADILGCELVRGLMQPVAVALVVIIAQRRFNG